MTCHEALTLLDDLVDGELDPTTAGAVESHLSACPSCAREFEETRRLKELLRKAQPPLPGQTYWDTATDAILARTAGETALPVVDVSDLRRRTADRNAFLRSLVSLAASLMILASALTLGQSQTPGPRMAQEPAVESTVILTAAVGSDQNTTGACFAAEDRERMARGMLLLGSPGLAGRMILWAEPPNALNGAKQ